MWRDPEWLQMGMDAMRATFAVEPALKQQMIDFLLDEGFWDHRTLSPRAAQTKFNACLNPSKPDFFKLSELWALMKRFRRYHLWLAMGADLGFEEPRQIPTEVRRIELLERLVMAQERAASELAHIHNELQRMDEIADERQDRVVSTLRVHPAMREVGPRFQREASDDDMPPGGF